MTDRDRLIELFEAAEKDPAITCPHYKTDKTCDTCKYTINNVMCNHTLRTVDYLLANGVIVPVRCKDCEHCKQLAPHCELNHYAYFHCELWRGEETKNVWHKYKKYYADYSIVEPNDYCSCGKLKEREG